MLLLLLFVLDFVPLLEKLTPLLFAEAAYHGFQFLLIQALPAVGVTRYIRLKDRPERHRLPAAENALTVTCFHVLWV